MVVDATLNYKPIADEMIIYGPMTVRSYLQSFTSIDVQRCASIRPIADCYKDIANRLSVERTIEEATGYIMYPYSFLRNNFGTVCTTLADQLFDIMYPTKEYIDEQA